MLLLRRCGIAGWSLARAGSQLSCWLGLLGMLPLAAQEPLVTLDGRVVDARGEPLPVARVWVTEVDDMACVLARGLTDADGVFRVPRVPLRDRWEVFACGDGASVTRATATSAARPVLLQAQPALRLGGTLRRRDGSPAVGVEVRGIAFALKPPIDEFAITDQHGRWQLPHLRPGTVSLVAAVPGEGFYRCNGLQLVDDDAVELQAGQGATRTLTVQLRDLPPAAAGKVFVELAPDNGFAGLPRPWHHPALDATGEVTLTGLPNVAYKVSLRSRDVLLVQPSSEISADAAPRTVVFEVLPESRTIRSMRARLRDAAGQPLAGVPLRLDTVAPAVARPALAVTDASGEARFECLLATDTPCVIASLAADVVVVGSHDRALAAVGESWLRHACMARDGVTVEVLGAPAVQLCGRVLDSDGAPIAMQVVGLGAADHEQGFGAMLTSTVTGPDGSFVMPVRGDAAADEQLVLTVGSSDFAARSRPFSLADAPRRWAIADLQLSAPGRLEVTVVDAAGAAVGGEVVMVMRHLANGGLVAIAATISDRDGHASFPALQPGDREVMVQARAGKAASRAIACTIVAGQRHALQVTNSR